MDSRAKKLKALVKNVAPKATYGTNPSDPWSAKADIFESSLLNKYLLSRGLQPDHVSKDTKIAHAKSAAYLTWAKNHQFEEVQTEDIGHLATKGEGGGTRNRKDSLVKTANDYKEIKTPRGPGYHGPRNEDVEVCGVCGQNPCICDDSHGFVKETRTSAAVRLSRAWDRVRQKSDASRQRAKDMLTKKPLDSRPDVKGSQTTSITPESVQGVAEGWGFDQWGHDTWTDAQKEVARKKKNEKQRAQRQQNKDQQKSKENGVAEETVNEVSQPEVDKFHKKLDKLVHSTFGKSSMEKKMKEETEQIDEISKELANRYMHSAFSDRKRTDDKMMDLRNKQDTGDKFFRSHNKIGKLLAKSDKRTTGISRALNRIAKEDVGDAKAAVHADGLTTAVDQMQAETKRQRSKSARMIKALYKKKGIKEDLYDHEKEDKSVATYGKKPKFEKGDKDDNVGEKKSQAAAVLTGGKTLTGTERDTVEIDPIMRNRPNQPDVTKKDDKKDDKDKKKEEKK